MVLSDVRGCREVVEPGSNGILAPKQEPIALATAIDELVADPALRSEMGAAGRRKAERNFDEVAIVDKVLSAYREIADLKGLTVGG